MCLAADTCSSYRIPQSDPPLEIRDVYPRTVPPQLDRGLLFQSLLSLSSIICGEQPPENIIYGRKDWLLNANFKFFITPRRDGPDSMINYATACQLVRGVGEYLARADIRYVLGLKVYRQGDVLAYTGVYPLPGAGGSPNRSAVDVA